MLNFAFKVFDIKCIKGRKKVYVTTTLSTIISFISSFTLINTCHYVYTYFHVYIFTLFLYPCQDRHAKMSDKIK